MYMMMIDSKQRISSAPTGAFPGYTWEIRHTSTATHDPTNQYSSATPSLFMWHSPPRWWIHLELRRSCPYIYYYPLPLHSPLVPYAPLHHFPVRLDLGGRTVDQRMQGMTLLRANGCLEINTAFSFYIGNIR